MRRNITWLTATLVVVALLIGYQFAYAGTRSDDRDTNRACATATAAASTTATATAQPATAANATTQPTATGCPSTDATRSGGDTGAHVAKPGENK
jgi:hypothetical protein